MGANTAAQLPRLLHRAVTQDDWDAIAEIYVNRMLPQQRAQQRVSHVRRDSLRGTVGDERLDEVERNGQNSYSGDVALAQAQSIARPARCCPGPNRRRSTARRKNRMCRCWC